ncbi:MAG TPA: hypothetical protein VJU59_31615 [Paraburkholderia sp.]|nr:hypothetical protein [Paraburkholderia sp.]HKR44172.1 hypothetical protein [Paraburkholderia sp.]
MRIRASWDDMHGILIGNLSLDIADGEFVVFVGPGRALACATRGLGD